MYTQSHLGNTSLQAEAATDYAGTTKKTKYMGHQQYPYLYTSCDQDGWIMKCRSHRTDPGHRKKITLISMEKLEKLVIFFIAFQSLSRREMRWLTTAPSKLPNLIFSSERTILNKQICSSRRRIISCRDNAIRSASRVRSGAPLVFVIHRRFGRDRH